MGTTNGLELSGPFRLLGSDDKGGVYNMSGSEIDLPHVGQCACAVGGAELYPIPFPSRLPFTRAYGNMKAHQAVLVQQAIANGS